MLASTRLRQHFDLIGDMSTHYGIFDGCGKNVPFASSQAAGGASGSWCCAPGDEARKGAARSSYFRLMTRLRAQIRFGRRAQAKAAGKGRGRLLG